jgi:hypothetical protein
MTGTSSARTLGLRGLLAVVIVGITAIAFPAKNAAGGVIELSQRRSSTAVTEASPADCAENIFISKVAPKIDRCIRGDNIFGVGQELLRGIVWLHDCPAKAYLASIDGGANRRIDFANVGAPSQQNGSGFSHILRREFQRAIGRQPHAHCPYGEHWLLNSDLHLNCPVGSFGCALSAISGTSRVDHRRNQSYEATNAGQELQPRSVSGLACSLRTTPRLAQLVFFFCLAPPRPSSADVSASPSRAPSSPTGRDRERAARRRDRRRTI